MMVFNLPSPKVAQQYRTSHLYEGDQNDEIAQAMKNCDPQGPLMIFVSTMVLSKNQSELIGLGRVYSGTAVEGQKVYIIDSQRSSRENEKENELNSILVVSKCQGECVQQIPCGNIIYLKGVYKQLYKQGTITSHTKGGKIRDINYSDTSVLKLYLQPKMSKDLPCLIQSLNILSQIDPLVQVSIQETGQYYMTGCSQAHIQSNYSYLVEELFKQEIKQSEPYVIYNETITEVSKMTCLAKAPNKANRIFCTAEPLQIEIAQAIQSNEIGNQQDQKVNQKKLIQQFN